MGQFDFNPTTAMPHEKYFAVNRYQQDPAFDWTKTQVIGGPNGYLAQNPGAAYTRWLAGLGIGPTDTSRFGQFMQQQYAQAQAAYKAALAEQPTLSFENYLNKLAPPTPAGATGFYKMFQSLNPFARGEDKATYAGPVRWLVEG